MNITADLLRSLGTDRKAFEARCDQIAALVQRNDKAALEAVCRIYDRQTADEKNADRTVHLNGIGFQECDAKFGGFIVRLYRKGYAVYPERMARVRKVAVKYRRQLAVLSFLKERAKAAATPDADREANAREARANGAHRLPFDPTYDDHAHRCPSGGCDVRGCCCDCR